MEGAARLVPRDERIATFARRGRAIAMAALCLLALRDVELPPGAPPQALSVAGVVLQLAALNAWSLWRSHRGDHGQRRQLTEVSLELLAAVVATTVFANVVTYQTIPPYLLIASLHAGLRVGLRRGVTLAAGAALLVTAARVTGVPPWAIPEDLAATDVGTWFPVLFTLPFLAALVGWSIDSVREAEDQLLAAHEAMERSNRALAGFARTIAHDLRAPLTAAAGSAELVRDRGAHLSDDQLRQLTDTLARSARRASDLVTDMLEAATPEARADRLATSDLRAWLLALLGPVVAEVEGRVEVTGTAQAVDLPVTAVRAVVLNLVTNSLKHTDGRPPHVRVTLGDGSDGVLVTVDDDGPGIPPEERDRVRRHGVRGTHASEHGSGHGLAAVERIVRDELDAELVIADSPLGGARLQVRRA